MVAHRMRVASSSDPPADISASERRVCGRSSNNAAPFVSSTRTAPSPSYQTITAAPRRSSSMRAIFNMAGTPPRTTGRRSLLAVWIGGPSATSDHRSIQSSNTDVTHSNMTGSSDTDNQSTGHGDTGTRRPEFVLVEADLQVRLPGSDHHALRVVAERGRDSEVEQSADVVTVARQTLTSRRGNA